MIEAMWAGRAVIATPAGGIPEMMEPGSSGFIARGCDTEALHEVMERAWSQRDHWEAMGAAGRRLVQERIPADPVKVWADHLLELAAAHGRP
jgi:glycosyltransferase involved in cell wall biosynthesis